MTGRVIKAVSGVFYVDIGGEVLSCTARGGLRQDGRMMVGDFVDVQDGVVVRVLPRANALIRPRVSNVARIACVIAPEPEPDLMLVDKLLIYAVELKIKTMLILNKSDLADAKWTNSLLDQYQKVTKVLSVSATDREGLLPLKEELSEGLTVFAGQSAVGKSSLLNAIAEMTHMETGGLSLRSGRGKHTTRHAEIFVADGLEIIDTPGFSMLDGVDLHFDIKDADYYYPEMFALSDQCRYHRCTHTHEPDCAVKAAVEDGKINAERYARYLKLREELNQKTKY